MNRRCLGALALVFTWLVVAWLVEPRPVAAGAANAELACSSIGTKLKPISIQGEVPGDFAEFTLTISQNGQSLTLSDQNGRRDHVHAVESWSNRVFTLAVAGEDPLHELELFAIPSSVVVSKIPGGRKVKFNAVAELLPIPGFTGPVSAASFHHDVKLKCSWQLAI